MIMCKDIEEKYILREYINQAIAKAEDWYFHSKNPTECYVDIVNNLCFALSLLEQDELPKELNMKFEEKNLVTQKEIIKSLKEWIKLQEENNNIPINMEAVKPSIDEFNKYFEGAMLLPKKR